MMYTYDSFMPLVYIYIMKLYKFTIVKAKYIKECISLDKYMHHEMREIIMKKIICMIS